MIRTVQILDNKNTAVKWLPDLPGFQSTYEFEPGVNLLWGPNGSGKSSLLRLLAKMFHCEQGQDEQKVTSYSLREVIDWGLKKNNGQSKYSSVKVSHDGSPVVYVDSGVSKGCLWPGFDDDFFKESLISHSFRGSSGQSTQFRLNNIIQEVLSGTFKTPDLNKVWDENQKEVLETFFKGGLEKTCPTILLDEPDRSLDCRTQATLWEFVSKFRDKVQFIIATHNLLVCDIPEFNYVTFGNPTYLERCRELKRGASSIQSSSDILKFFKLAPKSDKGS